MAGQATPYWQTGASGPPAGAPHADGLLWIERIQKTALLSGARHELRHTLRADRLTTLTRKLLARQISRVRNGTGSPRALINSPITRQSACSTISVVPSDGGA